MDGADIKMVKMSQTSNSLLILMYYNYVFSPVCAGGEGQPYLNHNFSCSQMAFAYSVSKTVRQMYQLKIKIILNNLSSKNNLFFKNILGINNFQSKFVKITYLMLNYLNNLNSDFF